MTIELSEYVIDAIANAIVKKMQEPILNKIRAEIEKEADISNRSSYGVSEIGLRKALKIIDKYRK